MLARVDAAHFGNGIHRIIRLFLQKFGGIFQLQLVDVLRKFQSGVLLQNPANTTLNFRIYP